MSELLLIPFGFRLSDQQFVDVSEVKRGRKCNCICPSCKTPLIARQGEVNDWHFAHACKGVSSQTENRCEYSFGLSVTLMAKQVIATASSIELPSLTMYTNENIEVKVSKQKSASLDTVKIEQKVNSVQVDATLKLGEYIIAVIFTASHRHFDDSTVSLIGCEKVGVLEISLTNAMEWLFGSNNQGKYAQVLKSNILLNNSCKRWLYHPRKSIIEKQYGIELYEKCPVALGQHAHTPAAIERKHYKCIMCNNNWYGTHKCNNCGTHLYSIELQNTR